MRAFTQMWDDICRDALRRARREAAPLPLRHAGELARAHRGAAGEQRAAHRARDARRHAVEGRARARAIQLPCWNEALGLPTPWDQQWSLRIQQVLAFESDLLEYGDLFDGSKVVEAKVAELREAAETELQWVLDGGGSFEMIDEMKGRLVQSDAERVRRIESGDLKVVGVNAFTETAPSPLADIAQRGGIVTIDPAVEARAGRRRSKQWRSAPRPSRGRAALAHLRDVAATTDEPRARDDRAGQGRRHRRRVGAARCATSSASTARRRASARCRSDRATSSRQVRARVQQAAGNGSPIRILVGKPGLDGHSNGAEQIAVAARDAGMEVVYQGIRLTPGADRGRRAATRTSTSSASRSCRARTSTSCPRRCACLKDVGVTAPVVVGGIIPDADRAQLERAGIARVFTPKDYRIAGIMNEVADLALAHRHAQSQSCRAETRAQL